MKKMLFSKLLEAFSLIKIEKNIKEAKNIEKAKDFYLKMLRRKLLIFLKKFKKSRDSFEKTFDGTREEYIKRKIFSKWFENIPDFKEKNRLKEEYYDKIIKKFRLVNIYYRYF